MKELEQNRLERTKRRKERKRTHILREKSESRITTTQKKLKLWNFGNTQTKEGRTKKKSPAKGGAFLAIYLLATGSDLNLKGGI